MKKIKNKNATLQTGKKGITLIALVITIIVLLILAGAAVSIGLNSGDLFGKANNAATGWNTKVAEEEDAIWNALNYIGMERPATPTAPPDGDNPTEPTEITFENGKVVAKGGTDVSSDVAGYEYSLDQVTWTKTMPELTGYKIGEEIAGEAPAWGTVADTKTETSEVRGETKTRKAPIPTGFTASNYAVTGFVENTIEKGLVIYEGTGSVADNHDTAMTSRNQYVWIPVDDINDMVMCTGGNRAQTVTVYVRTVDTTGNVSEVSSKEIALTAAQSVCNIVFDKSGNLVCSTHMTIPGNEHFLCGRLYGGGTSFGTQSPTTYTYNSGYREPAVVTKKSSGTSSLENYLDNQGTGNYDCDPANSILKEDRTTSVTGASNILEELKRQFTAMAKSVATYGGFYVGRYEAGYDSSVQYTTRKGTDVNNILTPQATNTSYPARVGNWYGLYNKLIQRKAGTVSQMIWGCQWDQVMKFVDGKKDNNGTGDTYSVTQAKTTEGTTRHTGSIAVTGANINDLVQNIYDLEGNFTEWTSTASNTYDRALRGGNGYSSITASYRDGLSPTSTSNYYSARSGLYVLL